MRVVVQSGEQTGQSFDFKGDRLTIGRGTSNDITINDPAVSRLHAQIVRHEGGFVLEDAKSANGTFVNDERIASTYLLSPGDVIRIGETTLGVEKSPGGGDSDRFVPGTPASPPTPATAEETQVRSPWLIPVIVLGLLLLLVALFVVNQPAPARSDLPTPALNTPASSAKATPAPNVVATSLPGSTATVAGVVPTAFPSVVTPVPVPTRVYPVAIPTVLLPVNQAKLSTTAPIMFAWEGETLQTGEVYRIQISLDRQFTQIACEIRTIESNASIPGEGAVCDEKWQFNRKYYWRVQVIQQEGTAPESTPSPETPVLEFTWGD